MNRAVLPIVVAVTLVAGGIGHQTARAATQSLHDCGAQPVGDGPKNDRFLNIPDVKARRMSCAAARKAIRAGTFKIHGCFGQPGPCYATLRTRGFRCKEHDMGPMRCTARHHRRRMFEFRWGE
jgi:hypothetical protein